MGLLLKVLHGLPLRVRLGVAFFTGFFVLLIFMAVTYIAADFSAQQTEELQVATAKLEFSNNLVLASTDLQLAATRYMHLGHASALDSVNTTLKEWSTKVDLCTKSACLEQDKLDDIKTHIEGFSRAFTLVSTTRNVIKSALANEFDAIREAAPAHSSAPIAQASADSLALLQINGINDHISTIEATLLAYFVTSDPQRIKDAEAHLAELAVHVATANDVLGRTQGTGEISIERVKSSLYANIQRIRSYTYLVNVVMPSEARELEYLGDDIARGVSKEITRLQTTLERNQRNFYVWAFSLVALVLLLSIPIFLWVLNSVISPLKTLAAVFYRLSRGSEERVIEATTDDEFGELFKAAEAFRQENVCNRQLLEDYQELSSNLESQVEDRTKELNIKNQELDRLASMDKLTETLNRRALDAQLLAEMERAKRYQRPLTLLLMDIDLFKRVNDEHGHLTGDKVLISVTQQITKNLRTSDIWGRWGGEEFLVICPETDLEQARNVAQKVRKAIEKTDFSLPHNITISIGLSPLSQDMSPESLVAQADKALYQAKHEGRNRVCTAAQTGGAHT